MRIMIIRHAQLKGYPMRSRFLIIRFIFVCLLLLLAVRVFTIQTVKGRDYSVAAAVQRFRNTEIYIERGDILDRNGIKFTDRDIKSLAVIQPDDLIKNPTGLAVAADILNMSAGALKDKLSQNALPFVAEVSEGQAKAIADASLKGLSVVDVRVRNNDQTLATHMIGYLDEQGKQGLSGIEKSYQETLEKGGGVYAGVLADAGNSVMQEFGYRIWDTMGEQKLNIKTTLDYHMQEIVEDAMDRMVDKGAVAIIDVLNGDILAIASRPNFNPADIKASLNGASQPFFNRALGEYTPGSIFKIITAAAALDNGISPDLTFNCPGYAMAGNLKMKCWTYASGGHGTLNMAQAFAQSCNSYFINLGQVVGRNDIAAMAQKFGLGAKTGLYLQGIDEPFGLLPETMGYASAAEIGNLSIGQGDLLISPIQAANMAAVIANGGILNKLSLIDCIINDQGQRIRSIKSPSWERVISKEVAASLQGMMMMTVEYGTGQLANIQGLGGSAGKTGSAETGWVQDNRNILHAWFVGYFPVATPRYAMCVFIEDGKSGGSSAAPVFAEISAKIMGLGY